MATKIPSRSDLYFENGKFYIKSIWTKRFRLGFIIGILLSGIFTTLSLAKIQPSDVNKMFFSVEDAALEDYVARHNKDDARAIVKYTMKWAKQFNLDPKLILAIQKEESRFDKYAISTAGALGLMQVIPKWHLDKIVDAKKLTGNPELFNIETNIYLGVRVIHDCLKQFKVDRALETCYSGGHVGYANRVLNNYSGIKKFVEENV